jgi:cytochrome o ubiquinol oxidase subunit II
LTRRLCRALTAGCCAALSGCKPALLDPQGPVGVAEKTILLNSLVIMLAIVVPTIIATLAFAWWFRAGNTRARYRPDFVYSGRIELVTWSIPVMVILFLGGIAWIGSHDLDPAKPLSSATPPLEVEAVSLDWKWLFIYPGEGIAAVNELTIPAGVPVHFSLTAASVMNVFFVPQLGSMIYTMNGMSDQLNLEADRPGDYYGESAHFSGDGFSGMHFTVTALAPGSFAEWVRSVRGRGARLDDAAYRELLTQSQHVPPKTYGAVEPQLYQMIVTQQLPPGPGPQQGRPNRTVSPRSEAENAR